jgi:hypothetical protein
VRVVEIGQFDAGVKDGPKSLAYPVGGISRLAHCAIVQIRDARYQLARDRHGAASARSIQRGGRIDGAKQLWKRDLDLMRSLLQPFQPALPADYVLVVPLDVSSFCQPALEILPVDLIGRSVADFGGFEAAFLFQSFFLKRLTTPKEKTDALL